MEGGVRGGRRGREQGRKRRGCKYSTSSIYPTVISLLLSWIHFPFIHSLLFQPLLESGQRNPWKGLGRLACLPRTFHKRQQKRVDIGVDREHLVEQISQLVTILLLVFGKDGLGLVHPNIILIHGVRRQLGCVWCCE